MSFLKEFHYSDIKQRKIIYLTTFFSSLFVSFIFSDAALALNKIFLYLPVVKTLFLPLLAGLIVGFFIGRLYYYLNFLQRFIFVITDLFLSAGFFIYINKFYLNSFVGDLIGYTSLITFALPVYFFILGILVIVKLTYLLKLSCGQFIDYKSGGVKYFLYVVFGILLGLFLPLIVTHLSIFFLLLNTLILINSIIIFLIHIPYKPKSQFAEDYTSKGKDVAIDQDPIIYTVLNFSYIVAYSSLSLMFIFHSYGYSTQNIFLYLIFLLSSILIGYTSGHILKIKNIYIFIELLFPIAIVPVLLALYIFSNRIHNYIAIFLFIPSSIIFGIALRRSLHNVINNYDYNQRFIILSYSMILLPLIIILLLNTAEFTNLVVYILLTLIILLNGIFPIIYLIKSKSKKIYCYLIGSYIIGIIISMSYILSNNGFSFSKKFFIKKLNYISSSKIVNNQNKGIYYFNKQPIFVNTNQKNINFDKALLAIAFYRSNDEMVWINGNYGFYKTSLKSLLPKTQVVNPRTHEYLAPFSVVYSSDNATSVYIEPVIC